MKALVMSLLLATSSLSYAFTGNWLLDSLNSKDKYMQGVSEGFIIGYAQAGDGEYYCRPPAVTNGQIIDLVKRVLVAAPEHRHEDASLFVVGPLVKAFPCAKKEQWSG